MHAPTFDFSPQIAKNEAQNIGTYAERKKNTIFGENHILSRETQISINSYFEGRKLNIVSKQLKILIFAPKITFSCFW